MVPATGEKGLCVWVGGGNGHVSSSDSQVLCCVPGEAGARHLNYFNYSASLWREARRCRHLKSRFLSARHLSTPAGWHVHSTKLRGCSSDMSPYECLIPILNTLAT